jgi:hypothetical protein
MYIVDSARHSNMKANKVPHARRHARAAVEASSPTCRRSPPSSGLRPHIVERHLRPRGLPKDVVGRINTDVQAACSREGSAGQARLHRLRVQPSKSPEEFQKYIGDQLAHWTQMVKAAGIKPE